VLHAGVDYNKALHYTAPYSTYSQARILQGEVQDVSPAAIATMQQRRTGMITSLHYHLSCL
jgi:hypothetical protein